jgi:precorrin-6B C5,15-methyltransferase / cobalt-precorrin-6B C5,C15-methyltransferase
VVLVVGGHSRTSGEAAGWLGGHPVDFPGPVRGWALDADAYAAHDRPTGVTGSGHEGAEDRTAANAGPAALPPEARALALARLGPRPGDLVWSVGAGSGSLAVEAARFGAAVVAVEQDPDACGQIAVNARRYQVEIEVVHGSAPDVLGELPEPDVVAVEHSGPEVVAACLSRRPERALAVPRTLAEAEAVRKAFSDAGYRVEGAMVQASPLVAAYDPGERGAAVRGQSLGSAAPVLLLWGER